MHGSAQGAESGERESCCEERRLLDMWGVPTGAITRNRLVHPLCL